MFYNSGFSYNGIHSSTYDIFACQIDSSNIEGQLLKQSLNTDKTKKSQKSNLYDMNKDNLTFTLTIATENWTNDKKDNVIKWLFSDTTNYSPLISDDDINVVYYQGTGFISEVESALSLELSKYLCCRNL